MKRLVGIFWRRRSVVAFWPEEHLRVGQAGGNGFNLILDKRNGWVGNSENERSSKLRILGPEICRRQLAASDTARKHWRWARTILEFIDEILPPLKERLNGQVARRMPPRISTGIKRLLRLFSTLLALFRKLYRHLGQHWRSFRSHCVQRRWIQPQHFYDRRRDLPGRHYG